MNVRTSGILVFVLAIALLTRCRFDLPPDKTLKLCESPKAISTVADAANTKKFTFSLTGTLADIKGNITWNITGDDKSPDPAVAGTPITTYTNVFSKGGSFTVTATGTTLCGEKINLTTTVTIKTCEKPTAITATPDAANPRKYTFAFVGSTNDITQPIDWLVTGDTKAQDPASTDTKTYSNTFSKGGTFTISATSTTTCGDKINLSTTITVKTCEVPTEITVTPDAANPGKYNFTLNGVLKDISITDWQIFRNGTVVETASIRSNNPSDFNYTYTATSDGTYTASATITTQCGDKKTLTASFTYNSIIASIVNMMVPIPAGTFQMGDTRNEGDSDEKPVHTVTVSGFKMGKYEITQKQYQAVVGSNPSSFTNCDDCPVEQVSWEEAVVFCNALSDREGRQRVYTLNGTTVTANLSANGYRLPTEAEWEYAAGGGINNRTRFGNGKDIANPSEMNFNGREHLKQSYSVVGEYRQKTIKVGSFSPNALGLFDMCGNVHEWCNDWYGDYSSGSQSNPTGPITGFDRVLRGGSWYSTPAGSRLTHRGYGASSSFRLDFVGFRVVSLQ